MNATPNLQDGAGEIQSKIIKGNKARAFLRLLLFKFMEEMDHLRKDHDVPDPDTVSNYLHSMSDMLMGMSDLNNLETVMISRHPEWYADYNARGWLDADNTERTCMSDCQINPYCWVSVVAAVGMAYRDACNELENSLYEKHSRGRKYGSVATRNLWNGQVRPRGRPKKNGPPPRPKNARRGRQKKPTPIVRNGKVVGHKASRTEPGPFGRGRPEGSRDSSKSPRQIAKRERLKREADRRKATRKP